MKIIFLESSLPGLRWMRKYYTERPQLKSNATFNYKKAKNSLRDGIIKDHLFEEMNDVFERSIINTPFSILYTVQRETVYIIDVRDGRGYRGDIALREYTQKLKKKYNL